VSTLPPTTSEAELTGRLLALTEALDRLTRGWPALVRTQGRIRAVCWLVGGLVGALLAERVGMPAAIVGSLAGAAVLWLMASLEAASERRTLRDELGLREDEQ
jgi:hypothetical protein